MSSNLVSEPVASAMSVCTLCDLAKRTRRFSVVLVLALRLCPAPRRCRSPARATRRASAARPAGAPGPQFTRGTSRRCLVAVLLIAVEWERR